MSDVTSDDRIALGNLLRQLWERAEQGDRLRVAVELVVGGPEDEAPKHVSVKVSIRDPDGNRLQRFRSGVVEGRHVSDAASLISREVRRLPERG